MNARIQKGLIHGHQQTAPQQHTRPRYPQTPDEQPRGAGGELVTQDGHQVLGLNGPIVLDPAGQAGKVTISEDGRIFLDEVENNTFQIATFAEENRLRKEGANLLRPPEGVNPEQATPPLRQGLLELSNVNVISEMVNMIAGFRAYETNSKVVQTHDALLDKAANEVARV